MSITVLLVVDHQIVRDKLQSLLRCHPDFELIIESDVNTAMQRLKQHHVDVIVLDIQRPIINGIKTADSMKYGAYGPPVILLSLHTDKRYVNASFGGGIAGYLMRDSAYEELPKAIRIVADGCCYLSPHIAETLLDGFSEECCRQKE